MTIKRFFIKWSGRLCLIWVYASVIVMSAMPLNAAEASPNILAGMVGRSLYASRDDSSNAEQGTMPRGARLEQKFCTQCHALPNPSQHTATQWPGVVARMERYMGNRNLPVPDRQQTNEILDYLGKNGSE